MANPKRELTQQQYNAIRDHLFDRIWKTGEEVKNHFPNLLRAAIESEAWKHFSDAEGKPFKNLVEWLHYTWPHGASMGQGKYAISYDEALKLTETASDVHRALKSDTPSQRAREQRSNDNAQVRRAKPSIYARLQHENPRAYQEYLFGQKGIIAAARDAGLVKTKPNQNLMRAKSAYRKMTTKERTEFMKWIKGEGNA